MALKKVTELLPLWSIETTQRARLAGKRLSVSGCWTYVSPPPDTHRLVHKRLACKHKQHGRENMCSLCRVYSSVSDRGPRRGRVCTGVVYSYCRYVLLFFFERLLLSSHPILPLVTDEHDSVITRWQRALKVHGPRLHLCTSASLHRIRMWYCDRSKRHCRYQ